MTKIRKKISNPITLIAIFATLSETSAAISLPFLEDEDRDMYIWFLISFPFYLLLLFFITLNFNYRSLYAPSDFAKEKHFMKILDNSEHPENIDPAVSSEGAKRHRPMNDQWSTSPFYPSQAPAPPGLEDTLCAEPPIRLPPWLNDLCIIDARWISQKVQFGALLETIQKPRERHASIILFLTCAESETALKESALKHSKQARKRDSVALYAVYNLNSHAMTPLDLSDQPINRS